MAAVALGAGVMLAMTPATAAAAATASSGGLSAVSCTSATACTAVGFYNTSSGTSVMLAARWNGTAWAFQPIPKPSGARSSGLTGVSCTSASACTAVGTYVTSTGVQTSIAEQWNGTAWAIQQIPSPSGATSVYLSGVSCTSASACTAVGSYASTSNPSQVTLAEQWNGTAWTIQPTPNPSGSRSSGLGGVSCTSASACTAVGSYAIYASPSNLIQVALAERWNGTAWAVQPTPNPGSASDISLSGVSCRASLCVAAGGYYDTSTDVAVTLGERWNGTAWTIEPTPNPSGVQVSGLNGVSCTSPSACTAVGVDYTSTGIDMTLAERWNGTSLVIQPTPTPGPHGSYLDGVSCASASACITVGYSYSSTGAVEPLAEGWNGTTWTVQPTGT